MRCCARACGVLVVLFAVIASGVSLLVVARQQATLASVEEALNKLRGMKHLVATSISPDGTLGKAAKIALDNEVKTIALNASSDPRTLDQGLSAKNAVNEAPRDVPRGQSVDVVTWCWDASESKAAEWTLEALSKFKHGK
eukprot:TRINITY_DN45762_c0_g1_i1.p1 TRINITY_DN45762_c0_g1~~TRINITY_DN45762_c0_g1_i1.p1  ORF type:complete len:155 (-),score=20.58 TRINITY_DN45762_c0_g1_i1:140-559(-)